MVCRHRWWDASWLLARAGLRLRSLSGARPFSNVCPVMWYRCCLAHPFRFTPFVSDSQCVSGVLECVLAACWSVCCLRGSTNHFCPVRGTISRSVFRNGSLCVPVSLLSPSKCRVQGEGWIDILWGWSVTLTVFEEPDDPTNRSFFSEIISSISDVKFSRNGRYMMTRDYLSVKVWDLAMESHPVEMYQVHEYLRSKLCTLYENDSIFDKFECSWGCDDRYVTCSAPPVCLCRQATPTNSSHGVRSVPSPRLSILHIFPGTMSRTSPWLNTRYPLCIPNPCLHTISAHTT